MKQEKLSIEEKISRALKITAFVGLFLLIFFSSFYTLDAGQRGVLLTFGKASLDVKDQGLHLKIPLVQQVVKMEVRTAKFEVESTGASKDLQDVHTKIAVNYHINPQDVVKIYSELGGDYANRIIEPAILETFKSVTAEYTAESLITQRPIVKTEIDNKLTTRLNTFGVVVDAVSLTNFDFSDTFKQAIEAKVTAEQNALKEENNLKVVSFQAQQKVTAAKGDAEAIRLINEQLNTNPQYINFMLIQKWNGIMPLSVGGGTLLNIVPQNNS
jgi:prohibitin 2